MKNDLYNAPKQANSLSMSHLTNKITNKNVEIMNNLTEVLAKLNKVEWTESERAQSIKGKFMNSEFEVTFRLKQGTMRYGMPFNCTVYVHIDNVRAFTWGCVDMEEVAEFNKWFLQTEVSHGQPLLKLVSVVTILLFH